MSFRNPKTGQFSSQATKKQCVVKTLTPEQIKKNRELLATMPSAQDVKDKREKRKDSERLARKFRKHERRVGASPKGVKPNKRHPQSFRIKPKPESVVEDDSPETYEIRHEDKGFSNNPFAALKGD